MSRFTSSVVASCVQSVCGCLPHPDVSGCPPLYPLYTEIHVPLGWIAACTWCPLSCHLLVLPSVSPVLYIWFLFVCLISGMWNLDKTMDFCLWPLCIFFSVNWTDPGFDPNLSNLWVFVILSINFTTEQFLLCFWGLHLGLALCFQGKAPRHTLLLSCLNVFGGFYDFEKWLNALLLFLLVYWQLFRPAHITRIKLWKCVFAICLNHI